MRILMTAAHGGFGSERVPLGGGAAIFERLCCQWAEDGDLELTVAGAGPRAPKGLTYHRLATPMRSPSQLGMLEYARFCVEFESQCTQLALELKPDVLLCHDVSEGPNMAALRNSGIKLATIFHVDVVDIFRRLYLGSLFSAKTLASGYRRLRSLPWPTVLKLVFEKQQQVLDHGSLSVVPSRGAARLLADCYPGARGPIERVGWGCPALPFTESQISAESWRLRRQFGIPDNHRILLTLSRLSPEKAQHRLLETAELAQRQGRLPADVSIVIAGAPAFMQGESHAKRLHRLADKLPIPVIFPGHVGGLQKAGWYRAAEVFVVNSLHESYGLTTLEAMQQGCPVVAVESFGTADTVSPDMGALIPPGPALHSQMWNQIERHLEPTRRREASQAAALRSQNMTFERAAAQLKEHLTQTLRGSSPGTAFQERRPDLPGHRESLAP